MPNRPRILVLCTGNSCRSQMTAAYIERLAGTRLEVSSAGTEPASEIHPLTREVLLEDGIDLGDARPRDYRDLLGNVSVDYLITVCDGAAKSCPAVWPGVIERLRWPFEDPAEFEGNVEERMAKFRQVRDTIKARVETWLDDIGPQG